MTNTHPTTIKEVLVASMKRAYFNGSTDVEARKNGVIPNDTKLGEVQIEAMADQALADIERILRARKSPPKQTKNRHYGVGV